MYERVTMPRTFSLATALPLLLLPASAHPEPPAAPITSPRLMIETMRQAGRGYLAATEDGGRAELTIEPRLQEAAEDVLRSFQIPYGAAVVLSVPDGRVLALVGHSAADPRLGPAELALRPWAPAASVFKVVSTTALLASGGVSAATRTCYHGGVSAVLPDNLVDSPLLDSRCG